VNNVLWAGHQIDNHINPTQSVALSGNPDTLLSGPALPKNKMKTASYWAHGLTVGIVYNF